MGDRHGTTPFVDYLTYPAHAGKNPGTSELIILFVGIVIEVMGVYIVPVGCDAFFLIFPLNVCDTLYLSL